MRALASLLASPLLRLTAPSCVRLSSTASASSSVADAITAVSQRLQRVSASAEHSLPPPRLVAVSKTKPVELIEEAYAAGHRDFGENYVQELVGKAPQLPPDVRWRFIGQLQSNKAKLLVHGVPSLEAVETVDSVKLADRLDKAVSSLQPPRGDKLSVFVQVNTSPWEGTKGGVLAEDAAALASHIVNSCPSLRLAGLMTIGAPGDARCFQALQDCRREVAAELNVDFKTLELSMGMSGDFEAATQAGSTSVRVGSSIFGAREYPARATP